MKVQMIYNNRDYITELDRPQAIEDDMNVIDVLYYKKK